MSFKFKMKRNTLSAFHSFLFLFYSCFQVQGFTELVDLFLKIKKNSFDKTIHEFFQNSWTLSSLFGIILTSSLHNTVFSCWRHQMQLSFWSFGTLKDVLWDSGFFLAQSILPPTNATGLPVLTPFLWCVSTHVQNMNSWEIYEWVKRTSEVVVIVMRMSLAMVESKTRVELRQDHIIPVWQHGKTPTTRCDFWHDSGTTRQDALPGYHHPTWPKCGTMGECTCQSTGKCKGEASVRL